MAMDEDTKQGITLGVVVVLLATVGAIGGFNCERLEKEADMARVKEREQTIRACLSAGREPAQCKFISGQ